LGGWLSRIHNFFVFLTIPHWFSLAFAFSDPIVAALVRGGNFVGIGSIHSGISYIRRRGLLAVRIHPRGLIHDSVGEAAPYCRVAMTEPFLKLLDLLLSYEQHLQHTKYNVLNFQSESLVKMRKLAHLEGELAGIHAAIEMVETVGSGAPVSSSAHRTAGSKK
jgi:hypothetical protein